MCEYNDKGFISSPEDISSMSAYHCKIWEGKAIIRLHDCHTSIRFWNNISDKEEVKKFIYKLRKLSEVATKFADYLEKYSK